MQFVSFLLFLNCLLVSFIKVCLKEDVVEIQAVDHLVEFQEGNSVVEFLKEEEEEEEEEEEGVSPMVEYHKEEEEGSPMVEYHRVGNAHHPARLNLDPVAAVDSKVILGSAESSQTEALNPAKENCG
ncbi:hypothetical protein lerEdw1_017660 [Lerista edwardsae]|nr:hypothetical protein lerEdw1_017660 [Lerista edwardsae]